MTTIQLSHIQHLTDQNAHGEALEYIASHFEYCKIYKQILHYVNAMHDIETSIPSKLGEYRSEVARQMLLKIRELEGEDIYQLIKQAI